LSTTARLFVAANAFFVFSGRVRYGPLDPKQSTVEGLVHRVRIGDEVAGVPLEQLVDRKAIVLAG
jgi:hypothetical protein